MLRSIQLVGAVIIVAIQNCLNSFGAWVTIVQGTIFAVCVLLFKKGLQVFWAPNLAFGPNLAAAFVAAILKIR